MGGFQSILKRFKPFVWIAVGADVCGGLAFVGASTLSSRSSKISKRSTCATSVCIALQADKANPDTVTLKTGEYAQFNSADGKSHEISLGLGGEEHEHTGQYNSGEFKADEAWRVQFKEPGTYKFHDHLNPKINVLVVVYKNGETPAIKS